MSDPAKRPGSRDISELKARLGLKKTGAPPIADGRPRSPTGGLSPPPGINLPPPPGLAQPQLPNAADDPFGAMNAMAQRQAVHRAPEIIIVNDGKPVEDLSTGKKTAKYGTLAAIAIVPLLLGTFVGQIGKGNKAYNAGISGARAFADHIKGVKKNLGELDRVLDDADGKTQFRPDADLTRQLETMIAKLDIKYDDVLGTNQSTLTGKLSGDILGFYAGIAEIRSMLDTHIKSAKTDDKSMGAGKAAADGQKLDATENAPLAGTYRFAVLFTNPTDEERSAGKDASVGAKIVELGPVFCGPAQKQSATGKCEDGISAFGYREAASAPWNTGDMIKVGPGEALPPRMLAPIVPNSILDGIVKGPDPMASEVYYAKRLRSLQDRVKKLIESTNLLEKELAPKASESPKFTFFM